MCVHPSSAQAADDDAALQPAEPDYRVINLATTLRLPLYKSSFELTHRFNGNLRHGDFGDQASSLFGIDEGATIGFEYRFAPMRHVQFIAYRANYDRTIQFTGSGTPSIRAPDGRFGVGLLSIEGGNNFRDRYATSVGATISRQIDDLAAVYFVPMWVHNVSPLLSQIRESRRTPSISASADVSASGRPSISRPKCRRASRASRRTRRSTASRSKSAPARTSSS